MITFDNKTIQEAVDAHEAGGKTRLAYLCGVSPPTINKMLAGEEDLTLSSIDQVASFLGFDVEIRFVKQARATNGTEA